MVVLLSGSLSPALTQWPATPVIIFGAPGSGRRTHAEALMTSFGAKPAHIWRLPKDQMFYVDQAREFASLFNVRTRAPRWALVCLDGASMSAQNIVLKTLEELPSHARVVIVGTPWSVLPTIKSRCQRLTLAPGTSQDEVNVIEASGIEADEAEILQALRPSRPGAAISLAPFLPARSRALSLLGAAEARDYKAIASGLRDYLPGTEVWVGDWVSNARANRPESHFVMASESAHVLRECDEVLHTVGLPRLAVRKSLSLLCNRGEASL